MALLASIGHWKAETWLAISTGLLAAATSLLASFTWRTAKAAAAEVGVLLQPMLVDAPLGVFMQQRNRPVPFPFSYSIGEAPPSIPTEIVDAAAIRVGASDGRVRLSLAIRNAGSGPALTQSASVEASTVYDEAIKTLGQAVELSHTVVPLGEPARISASWLVTETALEDIGGGESEEAEKALLAAMSRVAFTLTYTDMAGRQQMRSVIELTQIDGVWAVTLVTLYKGRKHTPFATLPRQSGVATG